MGTHGRNSDHAADWRLGIAVVSRESAVASTRTSVTPSGSYGSNPRNRTHIHDITQMARMHSRRRGSSGSDRPAADDPPEWSDIDTEAIEQRVVELAEQGHDPSQIGLKLRDEGVRGTPIPDVKLATGKKVTEILEAHGADADLPEDLRNLMAKAVRLHEHLEENPTDYQNKRALQNTESKIRRLIEYYRGDEIDEEFSYSVDDARDLV